MAPPPKHVLRLRRTDNKSAHFLVHVAQEGRNELDLKLIGTDKSELYVVSLTAADTKSYQDRNFNGSEEDFQTLLKFSFLHYRSDAILPASLQGVETVAAINGPTASITIRKNVDGITQRLGTIHLQENTSHTEIDTFDWVEAATAEADELRSQLDGLQISVESQKNSIAKLTTELDMLVRAKKAHEDDLLSKFAALLNAKKLKIRDQQRLLNGAQIDPVAATEVSNARLSRTTRKAGASRSGKRKAKATPSRALDGEQEESEEAIAEEDHTMNGSEEDTSRHDQVTPEPDHADAATESEDEEVPKPAAAARRSQNTQERRAERMNVGEKKSPTGATSLRKLPSRAARDSTPPVAADVDDEDEETDDELRLMVKTT